MFLHRFCFGIDFVIIKLETKGQTIERKPTAKLQNSNKKSILSWVCLIGLQQPKSIYYYLATGSFSFSFSLATSRTSHLEISSLSILVYFRFIISAFLIFGYVFFITCESCYDQIMKLFTSSLFCLFGRSPNNILVSDLRERLSWNCHRHC